MLKNQKDIYTTQTNQNMRLRLHWALQKKIYRIKEMIKMDPEAKIVIVSGYEESGPDGIDENVKLLIMGYLTKPFGMSELSKTISKALQRGA